ncbi:MAG TPA: beta-ketoacyl synthase N-terminal-like domain-containing protein, partial [Thermodesulfobacteriota bacterium]|nr:beta-ketoacyl synthase N-terminal-like domain-containing protein [Thermodesulfobacteriota bacterium]
MAIFVSGVGMTPFGKSRRSLVNLATDAGRAALADAGLDAVDALYVGIMSPEEFTGEGNLAVIVADVLGLAGVPAVRVETASSTGAAAFYQACLAIAAGQARRVLVVAAEKMTHLPTARTTAILAEVIDHDERRAGATMPALAALVTRCYMARHRLEEAEMARALAAVAIKNHANGALNPRAQFRRPITEADYRAARWVATPLRVLDCAPITDGAAAVVLTAEPLARPGGREGDDVPVRVAGLGQGTDTIALRYRTNLTAFRSTRLAARQAYAMAGVGPRDIDFAEVHDAFTPFEIIGTEDLGFFPEGGGARAALEGTTRLDGPLPVNPSGGLKARGHPVGASGLAQVAEAVWQLRGEAGPGRQLRAPALALVQSIGGLANNNFVTILERADRHRVHAVPAALPELPAPEGRVRRGAPKRVSHGRLESFTVLYVTPEGVPAPLVLGLVRTPDSYRILARGLSQERLAVGAQVLLRRKGYEYTFLVPGRVERLRARIGSTLASLTRPLRVRARWIRRKRAAAAASK